MALKIPKGWAEVSVDKFIQLKSVEVNDFSTQLSFRMDQLFILTDTDIDNDIWDTIPAENLIELFKQLEWLNTSPSIAFKRTIGDLTYKNKLTLGEFIDLEYLCSVNFITNLPDICAILYRKTRINGWGHTLIEPRGYNETERSAIFLEVPITDVYGALHEYLNLKKTILDTYNNMLDEEDKEEIEPEPDATAEDIKVIKQDQLAKRWAWERTIHTYSQKSNLTFNEVTNLPLIFFFNQLSMFHDLKL